MALFPQLIDNPNTRIIGFAGGKGRNYFVSQLATELFREDKKIVISHLHSTMLPMLGELVLNDDSKSLVKNIEKKIDSAPLIYAGRNTDDEFVRGIDIETAHTISRSKKIDKFFLILGPSEELSFLTPGQIDEIIKLDILDQLIVFFQMDLVDNEITAEAISNLEEVSGLFPQIKKMKTIQQKLLFTYLTNLKKGAGKIFKQKWPVLLVLTDVSNLIIENRAINLSRELLDKKIEQVYLANIKENLVKKVSSKWL